MSVIMKGITCCADCAYYNMKKHKCTRATDEGKPTDRFYADCPLPTVIKPQGWGSVKDRLPEKSGEYYVIKRNGGQDVLAYSARHKAFNAYDIFDRPMHEIKVTHWMPLPEPPKEETE